MAIASSGAVSIGNAAGSDRSINEELGITHNTANSSMTTVVTAAVTGTTPRGSGTVTEARPHSFSEWHSYVHTQDFGTPTYYVRNTASTTVSTQISNYCVFVECAITAGETFAGTAVTFFMKLNITTVEFYVDPDHTNRYSPTQPGQITSLTETARYQDTSGANQSFSGNFSSGFTPVKIAQLDTGSVSGRQARIQSTVIDDWGTHASSVSGYTIGDGGTYDTGWRTPHATTLYGVAPGAVSNPVAQSPFCHQRTPYHKLTMQIKATGYNTKTLNFFISQQNVIGCSDADPPL